MPVKFEKCSMCGVSGRSKLLFDGNEIGTIRDLHHIKAGLCFKCYRSWILRDSNSLEGQVFIEVLKKKINENRH